MNTFAELVTSRKAWLTDVLSSWCQAASLKDLRLAELEWIDIAGKVDPDKTLWIWAWSRFPALVHSELAAIDETSPVTVSLKDGTQYTGYPDARQSQQGQLVLLGRDHDNPRRTTEYGPFAIDEIATIAQG